MQRINLLYVITKLELGGAQKQLLSLIGSLDKEKYNVFLFTAREGLLVNEALSIDKLILHRSGFLGRSINPFQDLLALIELYSFIRKNRIQVVHTHSSKAGILGRFAANFARVPLIIHTVHGWSFHDYQLRVVSYFYLILEKISASFTSRIIVVSNSDRNKGLKNSIGRERQYIIIRYGIDYNEFKGREGRSESRKVLGLSNTDLAVGMVACFKPQKSPLDFIRLAAAVRNVFPDAKFIMIGDGPLRRRVCALIKKFNLEGQVILAGWRNDIPLILSALDVFVLTSLWEGLPIAALEAMAAGVPLVATDTGGIRDVVVNGKTGYLVKTGDMLSMQDKVVELLNNLRLRNEFVNLSKKIIDSGEFSLSNMVKKTEGVYSDLLKEGQNA
jgi:glycosyltransferase involved in cell wall biosynthesis